MENAVTVTASATNMKVQVAATLPRINWPVGTGSVSSVEAVSSLVQRYEQLIPSKFRLTK